MEASLLDDMSGNKQIPRYNKSGFFKRIHLSSNFYSWITTELLLKKRVPRVGRSNGDT